jgi:hypothetical protein
MHKFQHILSHNVKNEIPTNIIFFDTETILEEISPTEIKHNLRLVVALSWRRQSKRNADSLTWFHATQSSEFWDFVESRAYAKTKLYLIAHNIEFDMAVLSGWDELDKRGWQLGKLIINRYRQIWQFRKDNRTIECLDNMNLFHSSLANLGNDIGLPKLPMPAMDAPFNEWLIYCKRDVAILHETWVRWLKYIKEHDLGNFGKTIATQAFNAYRHRFMPVPICIHNSKKAIELEREAYHGGRSECFRLGKLPEDDYYLLDVNSMYPYVMREYSYPINLVSTGKGMSLGQLYTLLNKHQVIARVRVKTHDDIFGVVKNHRLIFPVGEFITTLTNTELLAALAMSEIVDIYDYAVYEHDRIFEDFVEYFYDLRQRFKREHNTSYALMSKLLLNSLYGKFGQRQKVWEDIGTDPNIRYGFVQTIDAQTGKVDTFRFINNKVFKLSGYEEGFNSFVAIAASVTANARLYLYALMRDAGFENVFYCDTDSLLVNSNGLANLEQYLDNSELGMLKVEQKSDNVILYGVKDYVFGSKARHKGISKKAEKVDDVTFSQWHTERICSGLRNGDINKMVWRKVTKTLKRNYDKGVLLEDNTIEPIILCVYDGRNYYDFEAMRDKYGGDAILGSKTILEHMNYVHTVDTSVDNGLDDWQPGDRLQIIADAQIERQLGMLPYQRGKRW